MPLLGFDDPDGTDVSQIKLCNFLHEKLRLCHALLIFDRRNLDLISHDFKCAFSRSNRHVFS